MRTSERRMRKNTKEEELGKEMEEGAQWKKEREQEERDTITRTSTREEMRGRREEEDKAGQRQRR